MWVAVEHVEDGDRRYQAVVITATDRRIEEEMAGLLESCKGRKLLHPPLDIGMAGFEIVSLGTLSDQHLVGGIEAGRLDVYDELRRRMELGQIAGNHDADLVSENLPRLVIDESAAVTIAVEAQRPALLVLTDSYFPGWHASIDGVEAPILPTDVAFRGVLVPPGTHQVTFEYAPVSFSIGLALAAGALIGLAAALWRVR